MLLNLLLLFSILYLYFPYNKTYYIIFSLNNSSTINAKNYPILDDYFLTSLFYLNKSIYFAYNFEFLFDNVFIYFIFYFNSIWIYTNSYLSLLTFLIPYFTDTFFFTSFDCFDDWTYYYFIYDWTNCLFSFSLLLLFKEN